MELNPGTWVRHPKQEGWGHGKVISVEGDKVRILFPVIGEKIIDVRYAELEAVEAPAVPSPEIPWICPLPNVDMAKLERLCNEFYERFKTRRSTTSDGRMAVRVLQDMRAQRKLSKATARQLFSWTRTGGSYTEGVDLAQEICRTVYGRIPTGAEIEAAGLS